MCFTSSQVDGMSCLLRDLDILVQIVLLSSLLHHTLAGLLGQTGSEGRLQVSVLLGRQSFSQGVSSFLGPVRLCKERW